MEMILGVIEDLLDKYDNGSPEDKEDAKAELKLNLQEFKNNLKPLVDAGNEQAKKILDRLNGLSL